MDEDERIDVLLSIIHDGSYEQRQNALKELSKFGKRATPKILDAIREESSYIKHLNTIIVLCSLGEEVIPELIKILQEDENDNILKVATEALGKFGEKAKKAAPALSKVAKKTGNDLLCKKAILALTQIGEMELTVSTLEEILREHSNYLCRLEAVSELARLSDKFEQATPILVNTLRTDENKHVREKAAQVLAEISKDVEMEAPALIEALRMEQEFLVYIWIAKIIERISEKAKEVVVPGLINILRKEKNEIQQRAAKLLVGIAQKEGADQQPRETAKTLERGNYEAADMALSGVRKVLRESKSYKTRRITVEILGKVARKKKYLIPTLLASLKEDEAKQVRIAAARALGVLREQKAAQPIKEALAQEKKRDWKFVLALALIRIEGVKSGGVVMLREMMEKGELTTKQKFTFADQLMILEGGEREGSSILREMLEKAEMTSEQKFTFGLRLVKIERDVDGEGARMLREMKEKGMLNRFQTMIVTEILEKNAKK